MTREVHYGSPRGIKHMLTYSYSRVRTTMRGGALSPGSELKSRFICDLSALRL